jgi:hypothetical protein
MPKFKSALPGFVRPLLALAIAGTFGVAFGQTTLVANSPFEAAGGSAAPGSAPVEAYELSGSSVEGTDVEVCIYDRQAKHSEWIRVGGTSGAIHVVSFDAVGDRAVVTVAGVKKNLSLRSDSVAASPEVPASAPVLAAGEASAAQGPAGASPQNAAKLLHDQTEARMLVSDLLEIGVQQRKAYQEAKQKAASEAPAQPTN